MCVNGCSVNHVYKIEAIAPCGKAVMIHPTGAMRPLELIDSDKLIKHARKFFRELGFAGDDWKIRVTKVTQTKNSSGAISETSTIRVFE